jgi:NTP pyrophosphatase (non-canonical NTP hydrolase)
MIDSWKLTLNQFQELSRKTAIYPKVHGTLPLYAVLGLCGESGEIAEKIKKVLRDKNGILSTDDSYAIAKELGDCLWYLAQIATELEMDLGDIANLNLSKIANRQQTGTLQGSGDNREFNQEVN